jgi:hypothetical protein
VDRVVLGGDAHHLRAAPGHGAQIGVLAAVALEHEPLGGVDLGDAVGDLEIEDLGGLPEALRVLGGLEDHALVGTLALEDARGVMERVRQHVELGILPGHELSVVPDPSLTLVEGGSAHLPSPRVSGSFVVRGRKISQLQARSSLAGRSFVSRKPVDE